MGKQKWPLLFYGRLTIWAGQRPTIGGLNTSRRNWAIRLRFLLRKKYWRPMPSRYYEGTPKRDTRSYLLRLLNIWIRRLSFQGIFRMSCLNTALAIRKMTRTWGITSSACIRPSILPVTWLASWATKTWGRWPLNPFQSQSVVSTPSRSAFRKV